MDARDDSVGRAVRAPKAKNSDSGPTLEQAARSNESQEGVETTEPNDDASVRNDISCSISSYNRDARTETLGDCRRSVKSPRRSIRNCLPHLWDLQQYNAMTPDRFLLAHPFTSEGKTQ